MTRNTARALAHDLHEGVEDVRHATERTARRLREDASELVTQTTAASERLARRAVRAAQARPRTTLAIGAVVGAIVAFLLRPRRR